MSLLKCEKPCRIHWFHVFFHDNERHGFTFLLCISTCVVKKKIHRLNRWSILTVATSTFYLLLSIYLRRRKKLVFLCKAQGAVNKAPKNHHGQEINWSTGWCVCYWNWSCVWYSRTSLPFNSKAKFEMVPVKIWTRPSSFSCNIVCNLKDLKAQLRLPDFSNEKLWACSDV